MFFHQTEGLPFQWESKLRLEAAAKLRSAKPPLNLIPQGMSIEPQLWSSFFENRPDSRGNRRHVIRIHEHTKTPAVQRIDRSIAVASDGRSSAAHRLEENNSESFTGAWHREHVCKSIMVG
jgi:hypothetical protein